VCGEVGRGERRGRGVRHRAAVEVVELGERACEVGLHEPSAGEEDARGLRIGLENAARPLRHAREPGRGRDAVPREPDRGLGERAERARPEARDERLPARRRAGNRRRADAALGHGDHRWRRRGREASARVEAEEHAVGPHHRQQVPTDPAHVGIGDGEREVRRHRGIDRVPAVAQHVEADRRRERQRRADGAAREPRHRRL
jgi:hypothetical protein